MVRAGSVTEEDESDDGGESGDDSISSFSSGSSMDGKLYFKIAYQPLFS